MAKNQEPSSTTSPANAQKRKKDSSALVEKVEPKPKRTTTTKKKQKVETTTTTDPTYSSSTTAKVDHRTLWEHVPVEIWHQVLSFLPTSHAARVSKVSKTLSEICLSWPRWKTICEKNKLGEPKRKFKSYLALVYSESYYICDRCDSRSTGIGRHSFASDLPLEIEHKRDRGHTWRLCHACRSRYYRRFKERKVLNMIDPKSEVDASWLIEELAFGKDDLEEAVPSHYERDLDNRRIPIYNELEATKVALELHAGWVGVEAAKENLARDVKLSYQVRKRRTAPKQSKK